ncbi:MAG: SDR family NAD(P)-dependent oxidoreductase [Chloroflexota bacterium]
MTISKSSQQHEGKTALVTGATSGIGFEAAAQLAEAGYSQVVVTGRTVARAKDAAAALLNRTNRDIFVGVGLDLGNPASIANAAQTMAKIPFDALLLNAGMISSGERQFTTDAIEMTFAASLIGHHRLTMQLLAAGNLRPEVHIVIAGSEAARGDVPMMTLADLDKVASTHYNNDLQAAAAGLIRGEQPQKFKPNDTYATTKLFVAWWAAALARRLPDGMVVTAVSPGSTPDTQAARNGDFLTRRIMVPLLKALPARFNMAAPVSESAQRYLEALKLPSTASGDFYASVPKKMSGPTQHMDYPHINNRNHQEASWAAVVDVAGIGTPA